MYRTSDLYFAAYLRVAEVPLKGVEREGNRVFFLFEDPGGSTIRELKDQYFMDQAKVRALSYSQAVKAMKALIFSGSP
jgi:hypothetical protein